MVNHETAKRLPTDCRYSHIDINNPLLMDRFDEAETIPPPRDLPSSISENNAKSLKKYAMQLRHPDLDLSPPSHKIMTTVYDAIDDPYKGECVLCLNPRPTSTKDLLPRPLLHKKVSSSQVTYSNPVNVPDTDDTDDPTDVVPNTSIGRRITKRFSDGLYPGTITNTWKDDDGIQYWTVQYDDDDTEDLNFDEIKDALALHELHPEPYRFSNDNINNSTVNESSKKQDNSSTVSPAEEPSNALNDDGTEPSATDPPADPVESSATPLSDCDLTGNLEDANNTEFVSSTVPRRSKRIRDKINKNSQQADGRVACLATRVLLGSMGVLYAFNSSVTPDLFANTAQSSIVDVLSPLIDTSHKNLLSDSDHIDIVTESIDQIEELRAYHAQVDRLNHLLSPDLYPSTDPTIEITDHFV